MNRSSKKPRLIIGKVEKEIIMAVGMGALVAASLVCPNLPLVLKVFLKKQGKRYLRHKINKLERTGLIYFNGEQIKLTKSGLNLRKTIQLSEISVVMPKKWDGLWRLVSYDVSEERKKERDSFRQMLERVGFRKVQKSLWVYPFDCKEQVVIMADNLGLASQVIYMETEKMPNQLKLEKVFNLST